MVDLGFVGTGDRTQGLTHAQYALPSPPPPKLCPTSGRGLKRVWVWKDLT